MATSNSTSLSSPSLKTATLKDNNLTVSSIVPSYTTASLRDPTTGSLLECPLTVFLEEQARQTPDALAVAFEDSRVSYAELNQRANRIARHLIGLGIAADTLVGVHMERSLEMVVALVGVVKAGGAYVPLDPEYPQDRLSFMFQDSGIKVLLTQRKFDRQGLFKDLEVVYLDDPAWGTLDDRDVDNPPLRSHPDSAVYMIYTSGSTGKPKGVVNIHRGLVNRLLWMQDTFQLTYADRVMQKTPYSFDVSVWEFFWPLITGACMVVAKPGGHRDNNYLVDTIVSQKVTTVHFVPSMLSLFLTSGELNRITSLRQVMSSGEALPLELTRRFFTKLPSARLHNLYGPTEAAIDVTHWECTPESTKNVIPIGRPITNIQTYILDEAMVPVPAGETGELHIGGVGLARGYWNRPELTQERFVKDPFSQEPGARLYKTGDLARNLPDGSIEYLGRLDFQIKLRGFRIELGEIEAVLLKRAGVLDATVIATDEALDERQLIAYLVADKDHRPTLEALHNTLRVELPEYMVPSRFVFLDEMPLLPNGKVNRKALPKTLLTRPEQSEMYVAPNTPLQKRICEIWSNLLGIAQVGIRDNFFNLGGNSIRAVRLATELKRSLNTDVPLVKIFEYPSIEKFADYISAGGNAHKPLDDVYERAARIRNGRFSGNESDGIAVIGMNGRFPGAKNLDELWKNLCNKVESISHFSLDEIGPGIDAETKNDPDYVPARGILDDADKFDARFFGIGPLEAKAMDPQQRVFLELAWAALENAGYDSDRFSGMIGVYAGVGDNHYFTNNLLGHPDLIKTVGRMIVGYGNEKDYIATRVSYALNLTGPSVSANTGCSTSLLAVDNAFKALTNFECDMALAGGVDIFFPQKSGQIFKEGGTFTKDGHCRPFDSEASGTMFCDGAGVVVLRRLEDAIAAGDHIYAVIRGIAKNNDGANKVSFLAPSVDGQAKVIALAQAQANVLADTITYVEAHGTGTPLGDPIEVEALTRAFRATTDRIQFCLLGSIKGNIGHPTIASGVAGLIKTCLALHHEVIPATLHFNKPNPRIHFEDSPFRVVTENTAWPRTNVPRRAGVSSFGFGGTNVHAILEEAPLPSRSGVSRPQQLLLLSAKSDAALGRLRTSFKSFLTDAPKANLPDVSYTTQVGRKHLAFRQFVVASNTDEASTALASVDGAPIVQLTTVDPLIVFMFPGQGSQYVNMGRALYASEVVYRQAVDACCELFAKDIQCDLREILFATPGEEVAATDRLRDTRFTQPALFTVEYALAKLWMSLGIVPKALIGHSVAEFVCACIAGSLELAHAIPLVALRGRLMGSMPRGSMLSVRSAAAKIIDRLPADLQLAANNAPGLCVVAGPTESIASFAAELEKDGIAARLLQTSHAFHSSMMEPIVAEFDRAVRRTPFAPPQIPILSTCVADWMTGETIASPEYWSRQLRMPVLFSDAISKLVQEGGKVFLEVGPKDVLSTLTRQHVASAQRGSIVATLGSGAGEKDELPAFLRAIGGLWTQGASINWDAFYAGERRQRIPLPTYPFERTSYFVSPTQSYAQCSAACPYASSAANSDLGRDPETASSDATSAKHPQTIMDRICAMISTVAGIPVDNILPTKTYIELGFDSISLMQLEVVLHKEFGVKLTWRQLLEDQSTPAKLELLVRATNPAMDNCACVDTSDLPSSSVNDSETVLPSAIQGLTILREAGPKRLYLAYDGEGDVLQYLKFARSMPEEFSIYGLSPMRLPNVPQVHTTVQDMAKHCISVIRQKQPKGPYLVGGLCAGGVVAFEMAKQFEQSGEHVDWIVLLDAINPGTPFRPFIKTRDRLGHFLEGVNNTRVPTDHDTSGRTSSRPSSETTEKSVRMTDKFNYVTQRIRNLVAYEVQNQIDTLWIAARIRILRKLMKGGQEWPHWLTPLRELEIFMAVKGDYHPGSIRADMAIVRATREGKGADTPARHFVKDPVFGWNGHTSGRMEIIDSPGGHVSMLLDEPWFSELAEQLGRVLMG